MMNNAPDIEDLIAQSQAMAKGETRAFAPDLRSVAPEQRLPYLTPWLERDAFCAKVTAYDAATDWHTCRVQGFEVDGIPFDDAKMIDLPFCGEINKQVAPVNTMVWLRALGMDASRNLIYGFAYRRGGFWAKLTNDSVTTAYAWTEQIKTATGFSDGTLTGVAATNTANTAVYTYYVRLGSIVWMTPQMVAGVASYTFNFTGMAISQPPYLATDIPLTRLKLINLFTSRRDFDTFLPSGSADQGLVSLRWLGIDGTTPASAFVDSVGGINFADSIWTLGKDGANLMQVTLGVDDKWIKKDVATHALIHAQPSVANAVSPSTMGSWDGTTLKIYSVKNDSCGHFLGADTSYGIVSIPKSDLKGDIGTPGTNGIAPTVVATRNSDGSVTITVTPYGGAPVITTIPQATGGGIPTPPASGSYVLMSNGGVLSWVATSTCP